MAASPFHDCLSDAPHAHFLTADNVLTTQRMDPIQYPGTVGSHVHSGLCSSSLFRVRGVYEGACSARREWIQLELVNGGSTGERVHVYTCSGG